MMTTPPFVEHCLELLAPLGTMHARRMFGGWGLYADGLIVAIVAGEHLYLKAAPADHAAYTAAGCAPFVYSARTGGVAMSYWSAPADALDSPALMAPWARRALQAALTAKAAQPPRKPLSKVPAARARRAGSSGPATPAAKRPRTRG